MIVRKKDPIINFWEPLCTTCKLIVELESDSAVKSFSQYLKDTVYALRLRKNGSYLERHNDINKIPSFSIPKSINDSFSNLEEIANYIQNQVPLNFEEGYGVIATSQSSSQKKYVAISIPHLFSDGKYFVYLIDNYINKKGQNTLQGLPDYPYFFGDVYKDFYHKAPKNVKDCDHNEKLTRFRSNDIENLKDCEYDEYQTIRYKSEDLKNKVIKNNKVFVSNYTENLYMSNYFAICAHENKLLNSFGVHNIVDLRQFRHTPSTFANVFEISGVSPFTENIESDMTVSEVAKNLRISLNEKIKNNEQFANCDDFNRTLPKLSGIYSEFTNIGAFHVSKPIIDLWFSISAKSLNREIVSNMGFSVVRDDFGLYSEKEKENRSYNDMVLRYRYAPRKLSMNESKKIAKSIEFFMKNISLNEKVGNAFDEIKQFYKSIDSTF